MTTLVPWQCSTQYRVGDHFNLTAETALPVPSPGTIHGVSHGLPIPHQLQDRCIRQKINLLIVMSV
eukprot:6467564-Amphidinium_carterae.1